MDDLIYLFGIFLVSFIGTMSALFAFYGYILNKFAEEGMGYVDVYKSDDMQT